MLRRSTQRLVRNPVKDDSRAFYTWFSGNLSRCERGLPGGYPTVKIFPVYGKRWSTGRTVMAVIAGLAVYGTWMRPEKERYNLEMTLEWNERHMLHLPYQKSECNLRTFITSYKRHRYEEECVMNTGQVGLTPEFRKFYYHDDVWRPPLHDVMMNPMTKFGGAYNSYTWHFGYF